MTVAEPMEMVTAITRATARAGQRLGLLCASRPAAGWTSPRWAPAAYLALDQAGKVCSCRIALASVAPTPLRLP